MSVVFNRAVVALSVGVLLSYLVFEWSAFFRSEVFVFTNGWDEETYLSWQGAIGARNEIGYFVLHLYSLLQEVGISGAMQNLLSDTIFPTLTLLFLVRSFKLIGIERSRAFPYAVLTLFSSTLFNYANPLIKWLLGNYNATAILMAGWELYPSILRTPNPQLSYFLITLAAYAWLRFKKWWVLLLPLPLLYYFVAVPYACLIAFGMLLPVVRRRTNLSELHAIALCVFIIYPLMTGMAAGLFYLAGYYDQNNWVVNNPWIYSKTQVPQIPVVLLFILPLVYALGRFGCLESGGKHKKVFITLIASSIATVNLHIITGFMLSQKNYYDYGLSILFGLMLVTILEWSEDRRIRDWMLAILLATCVIPTFMSHYYFYKRALAISTRAEKIIDDVRRDPIHAVIPDLELSSRLAYSTAELLAPPYSYQYYFPFIERQCSLYPGLLSSSLEQIRFSLGDGGSLLDQLEETANNIRRGQAQSTAIPYRDYFYCIQDTFRPAGFKVIGAKP